MLQHITLQNNLLKFKKQSLDGGIVGRIMGENKVNLLG
jgi:hypothetical protein